MRIALSSTFVVLLAMTALAAPLAAQQTLFMLDEDGQIWRVDNHTATTLGGASAVLLGQFQAPGGASLRDFAVDPASGDFWVHAVAPQNSVQLLRLDAQTLQPVQVCATSYGLTDGLDINSNGWLVLQHSLTTLVFWHPGSCQEIVVPTGPLAFNTSFASLAFDTQGQLASANFDGQGARIDPYSGVQSGLSMPAISGVRSFEIEASGHLLILTNAGELYRTLGSAGPLHQPLDGVTGAATLVGLALSSASDLPGVQPVCDGTPNSTGAPGSLDFIGSTQASANAFELRARSLPSGQAALFVMGSTSGNTPVGQGTLCIAAPFTRIANAPLQTGSLGQVMLSLDLTDLPTGGPALQGDVFLFQLWHRDVGATSNLTGAREVTFQ